MGATAGKRDTLDVLIVGAGVSGIGAAYYLQRDHPGRSYAILEAREASGGTWDLFRYPGVRSDSDLQTFGYEFRPWRSPVAIAEGDTILAYLRDTAAEYGIDRHIRYGATVTAAGWSSADARWTVTVSDAASGEQRTLTARWLFSAAGYYRYDQGYTPRFEGRERFRGPVVHPQSWPAGLDYAGQRVVVIGSGATAVTLVPAMAATAGHVTMLQRTPSYVLPLPATDKNNGRLARLLGPGRAYAVTRRMNIFRQVAFWRACQKYPGAARRVITDIMAKHLPDGYAVGEHFNPPYDPWAQRMCIASDGDLFRVIRDGTASVVTGEAESFTPGGVRLSDGRELPADVIVTATGLNVRAVGGMTLSVDGSPVRVGDTFVYKGMMLSGVPNFAFIFGYTNASWTLKVGLVGEHFARLLRYMDSHGYDCVTPVPADKEMASGPLVNFQPGYLRRAFSELPQQGSRAPWRTSADYGKDLKVLRRGRVDGPELEFSSAARRG